MHAVTIKLIKLEYYEKGSTLACCGRSGNNPRWFWVSWLAFFATRRVLDRRLAATKLQPFSNGTAKKWLAGPQER